MGTAMVTTTEQSSFSASSVLITVTSESLWRPLKNHIIQLVTVI